MEIGEINCIEMTHDEFPGKLNTLIPRSPKPHAGW